MKVPYRLDRVDPYGSRHAPKRPPLALSLAITVHVSAALPRDVVDRIAFELKQRACLAPTVPGREA